MDPRLHKFAILGLVSVLFLSGIVVLASANTVPDTKIDEQISPITAELLKVPDCSALTLTTVVICPSSGGVCDGSDANELILGSPSDDHINAGKGDDCILGGGGDDRIRGNQGADVCIGGAGTDDIDQASCETGSQ